MLILSVSIASVLSEDRAQYFQSDLLPVYCQIYTGYSASVLSEIKNYSQCHTSWLSVCCQTDIYVTSLLSEDNSSIFSK